MFSQMIFEIRKDGKMFENEAIIINHTNR